MTERTLSRGDFLTGAAGLAAALGLGGPARAARALIAAPVAPPAPLPTGWIYVDRLQGGWTSHPDRPLRFRIKAGVVDIEGQAVGGNYGRPVFTLPPGCRPGYSIRFADVDVHPGGAVVPRLASG